MTPNDTMVSAVLKIIAVMLFGELLIMLVIDMYGGVDGSNKMMLDFIDPIALVVIVSPALYFLIFLPMKKQQAKLQEQFDALRVAAITFETHDAILITNSAGYIVSVNNAFAENTGYSAQEVIGKRPNILKSGRHNKEFYTQLWGALLRDGVWEGEIWNRRKSGEAYPEWLRITAVKNKDQKTTHYVGMYRDAEILLHQDEKKMHQLAFYDGLTGLPNRGLFLDRFQAALPNSLRNNNWGAILFIDLDHFKTINDTLGHNFGDILLTEAAQRIQASVRKIDTVARLGGDEFVVLIEGVGGNSDDASRKAMLVAEKIRTELVKPYTLKEAEHRSSCSIGIALFHGAEETIDTILQHADIAMYQAKNVGRNAVRFFDHSMQQDVIARAVLEKELHQAIEQGQLRLFYQIQVDRAQKPLGAEVLLRWVHPERGLIPPSEFIPIAEENGLILTMGQWVLETACAQINAWRGDPVLKRMQLAVNVSSKQFQQPDFVEKVVDTVERHAINPHLLKLELTESVVLKNIGDTIEKMRQLKYYGIELSLDDFGTGYSSLSYLKLLPLDQIKIDQAFVRDMTENRGDMVMIQTVVDLGINFELEVIAEGVETEMQFKLLSRYGCGFFQGYMFSKPIALDQFEVLIRKEPCAIP